MSELSNYEPEVYAALRRIEGEKDPDWLRRLWEFSSSPASIPPPDQARDDSVAELAWAAKCRSNRDWEERCIELGLAENTPWQDGVVCELTSKGRLALEKKPVVGPELVNGQKMDETDVPPEYREGGKRDGPILSGTYLKNSTAWNFTPTELTRARESGKLTRWIKVGAAFVHRFDELCAMRDKQNETIDD